MGYENYARFCPVCSASSCQEGCTATGEPLDPGRRERELALAAVIDELIVRADLSRISSCELTEDGRIELITEGLPSGRFFVTVEEDPDHAGRS